MISLLQMTWEFFKTGLFAIGGGLATIPFLYDIAGNFSWFSKDIIPDMIAVSESTPGPIGVNMATYAGYTSFGVPGSVAATLGLVVPSVIIILIAAKFLEKFRDNFYVKSAFYGIRPAVAALITLAGIEIFKTSVVVSLSPVRIDVKAAVLFLGVFVLTRKFKIHPVFYILAAAFVGIIFKF